MTVVKTSAWPEDYEGEGEPLDVHWYIDDYLKEELDEVPHLIETNYDSVFIIFGFEGSGKTTLGIQIGYYLDPDFSIENVVFTAEGFREAVNELPKGSVILWDEAEEAGSHHASKKMSVLKDFSKEMRQEKKKCILIQPTLLDYNKYFIKHRSILNIRVKDKPWKRRPSEQRGYWELYSKQRASQLYTEAKKNDGDLSVGNPNKFGRFIEPTTDPDFPVRNVEGSEYRKKKRRKTAQMQEEEKEPTEIQSFTAEHIHGLLEYCKRKGSLKEVAEAFDWNYETLKTRKNRLVT